MAVLYLISVVLLWAGMMMIRKSETKQNLFVWLISTGVLTLSAQSFFGGLLGKTGIAVSISSVGIMNLAAAVLCGIRVRRKGLQRYCFKWQDVACVAVMILLGIRFALGKHGTDLHIDYVSVDAAVHARYAKAVALEHRIPLNLFFTAVPTGLLMEVYLALFPVKPFDTYRIFVLCEDVYLTLSALIFWALLRQRCGEGKWQLLLPIVVIPFYWMAYPVYSTLFGFSYLGMSVNLIALILILLNEYIEKGTDRILVIIGLNLALFGIMTSYTMFIPTAFFGVFLTVALQIRHEKEWKLFSGKTVLEMLRIFLIPTVLGMLYAFVNLKEISPAGGAITNEGGCYNEIYSNFVLLIPLVILGIYYLIAGRTGRYILPTFAVHAVFMLIMFIGLLTRRVSDYYYVKNNNILWLLVWLILAEGILAMMKQCKAALLLPLFFYVVLFMAQYGENWIVRRNPLAFRVRSSGMTDLILLNRGYYRNPSEMTPELMELYRYADDHFEQGEVAGLHSELPNAWFSTLTGQKRILTYGGEEDLKKMVADGAKYICAGTNSAPYDWCRNYLDDMEIVFENEAGKIFKVPDQENGSGGEKEP